MISTFIKEPILVKATQVKDSDNQFYFEFKLTGEQKSQLIAELLVEHVSNGSLTVVHTSDDTYVKKIELLREMIKEHPDMPPDLKNEYLKQILNLLSTQNEPKPTNKKS